MSVGVRHAAALFLLAATLRVGALFTPLETDVLFIDEAEYAHYAEHMVERGEYAGYWYSAGMLRAHRTPLYPSFIALNRWLAGKDGYLRSTKWMQIVLGSLIAVLVYGCVLLVQPEGDPRSRRRALACGAIAATYPYLILYGLMLFSELVYTFLALTTTYCMLRALREPERRAAFAVAGLSAGLATLTRPNYALFPIVFCALALMRGRLDARRVAAVAALLVAFGATLLPWVVRNWLVLDRFPVLSTNGGEPFWFGHNVDARGFLAVPPRTPAQDADWAYAAKAVDELDRSARFLERSFEAIRRDPLRHVLLALPKAGYLWNVEVSDIPLLVGYKRFEPLGRTGDVVAAVLTTVPFVALTLAFLASLWLGPRGSPHWALTSFVAYSTLIAMVFFGCTRYHLPFVPQMIVCTATVMGPLPSVAEARGRWLGFGVCALLYLGGLAWMNLALEAYRVF